MKSFCLQVEQAYFNYASREVLKGINLELTKGEIYALLGPNGAGKSTFIAALCGEHDLISGKIHLNGLCPFRSKIARHYIGLVPQDIALYSTLTIQENLVAFGQMAGVAPAKIGKAVDLALRATDLEAFVGQYIKNLSGGYQRRVNIAAAILHDPSLLILDEPMVGVDLDGRQSLHSLIRRLARSGMTVFMTTHDLEQAEILADRVGILIDGQIVHDGPPQDLIKNYYGHTKEIVLKLKEDPDSQSISWLQQKGFRSSAAALMWRAFLKDVQDMSQLTKEIEAKGLHLKELSLRNPGLESLFLDLVHERSAKS